MSKNKPLEALEKLRQNIKDNSHLFDDELLDIIEKALKEYAGFQIVFKLSNRKEGKKIYDKLKALEIIKEKEVNIFIFSHSKDLEDYNCLIRRKITQQEYDLLKEVLEDD